MDEPNVKARCTHRTVANFLIGGMREGWRHRWLCDFCRAEFVPLAQVKVFIDKLRSKLHYLNEASHNFCCAVNVDHNLNQKAFGLLCDLATQCECTYLSWWDEEKCTKLDNAFYDVEQNSKSTVSKNKIK